MSAGVVFTVAELLGGMLAISAFGQSEFYPLVKDMQIKYTAPTKTDVRSQASLSEDEITRVAAEAAADGKSDYTVDATVTNLNGTLVAVTRATCELRVRGK
jgi:acyl-coenzyme A thioesterase PaaI-like protein